LEDIKCSSEINKLLENLDTRLNEKMKSLGGRSSTVPFSIVSKTNDGKTNYTIYLPKNIESILDVFPVLIMLKCARYLNFAFESTETKIEINETSETKAFFLGYSTELFSDKAPQSLTLKKSTDSNKGTTAARLLKLRTSLRDEKLSDISFLLPDSIYADTAKRIEHLTVFLHRGLQQQGEYNLTFVSSFKSVVSKYVAGYSSTLGVTEYLDIKIHVSEVIKGLHRKIKRRIKGRETLVTITPNRPSKRVEILSPEEQKMIESCEGVFQAYENKIKNLTHTYVKIRDVKATRDELSSLIAKMWDLVRKMSPVLSPRSKILSELIKKELKKNDLTKQNISEVLSRISSDASEYDLKVFRALNVIEVANRVCSINNEKVGTYGYFEFRNEQLRFQQMTVTDTTAKAVISVLNLISIDTSDREVMSFNVIPSKVRQSDKKSKPKARKGKGKGPTTTSPKSSEEGDPES